MTSLREHFRMVKAAKKRAERGYRQGVDEEVQEELDHVYWERRLALRLARDAHLEKAARKVK